MIPSFKRGLQVTTLRQIEKEKADELLHCKRWKDLQPVYLAANPLCERCKERGFIKGAQLVHHKQSRRTNPELAYEWSNLMSLCIRCHNIIEKENQ